MKHAIQTVKKNSRGGYDVVRYGFCPEHRDRHSEPQRTTKYIGVQQNFAGTYFMTFRCKEKGGHTFNNSWPLGLELPSVMTPESAKEWMRDEIAKSVYDPKKATA